MPLSVTHRTRRIRGFTLLESLIASAVLAMVVLAVGAAVTAAQRTTMQGRNAVLAAMAADDLLSEIVALHYSGLDAYHGFTQPEGAMATLGGAVYPREYRQLGRSVVVETVSVTEPDTGAVIAGKRVVVACFEDARVLAELETFLPEPAP